MMARVSDLIPTKILEGWDKTSYQITAPPSLDCEAAVVVHLINKDLSSATIILGLHEGVEI